VSSRPKRKFKHGEHEPEQCEVFDGDLGQLDELLAKLGKAQREPTRSRKPTTPTITSKLADELEPLGFYKYISSDQLVEIKAEISQGAYAWFLAAGRAFGADCERLAEGGVEDLIDYMRPALQVEGCAPGAIDQSYEPENGGYTLTIGTERKVIWNGSEARNSWQLATTRTAELINRWLTQAGSQERLHLLNSGHDGVFVLLTPSMRDEIAQSRVFRDGELPVPI
jgi:hypothetical protein